VEEEYEIFETLEDRSVIWRTYAQGTKLALAKLEAISQKTSNECFAIHLGSQTVIGRVNQAQSAAA
jgi:hypothetical protein